MDRLGAEKAICHAERLIEIREKGDTYPVHMAIGITDYCCHKCIFCNTEFATADTERIHSIDANVLINFLMEAKDAGLKAVTICGSGEPLIHPHIDEILYGIHDIGLEIGILRFFTKKQQDINLVYSKCLTVNDCKLLRRGRLYPCPQICFLYEKKEYLQMQFEDTERDSCSFELYKTSDDDWDMLLRLRKPFSMCRFCLFDHYDLLWGTGKAEKTDWVED